MIRTVAAIAVVGAASAACGQTWEFELDNPILWPGDPSTTVTLSLDPGPGADYVAGANFSVHASEGEWSDPASLVPPSAAPPASQNPGTIIGSSVEGISVGQLTPLFGFQPIPGRIDLWEATFTVIDFPYSVIELRTETERMDVYLDATLWRREMRTPVEGRIEIIIPAPAGAAIFGLGGLTAMRRRR